MKTHEMIEAITQQSVEIIELKEAIKQLMRDYNVPCTDYLKKLIS